MDHTPKRIKHPALLLALLFFLPQIAIPLLIGWAVFTLIRQHLAAPKQDTPPTFDGCPQSRSCLHKDKGEHHVRKGKEIDPWDRPDIDIRKYQRNP